MLALLPDQPQRNELGYEAAGRREQHRRGTSLMCDSHLLGVVPASLPQWLRKPADRRERVESIGDDGDRSRSKSDAHFDNKINPG
jgi:hypothetical protein